MNLIRPSYEIIEQGTGLQGIYDIIEKCGKVSYKSEAKGGETAKKFVEARTNEGHGAVLEFGTVYLCIEEPPVGVDENGRPTGLKDWGATQSIVRFYNSNKYSKIGALYNSKWYITTNYRVLVENNRLDDLKYLCEPTEYHEKRYAVKFITDIGVGREFLRHRVMSMVQESTRYVNYMKEKFGKQVTFVIPPWIPSTVLAEGENISWWDGDWVDMNKMTIVKYGSKKRDRIDHWLFALNAAEDAYTVLTNDWSHVEGTPEDQKVPWLAQQARGVLPLATKTEFVLCGFKDAWVHFFCLRTDIAATGKPHPQAQELANPLKDEFIERQYVIEEDLKHDTMAGFDVCAADNNLKP
jgi:thymidylate synthase (FAD)